MFFRPGPFSEAADHMHRPFTWRFLMRRVPRITVFDRSAGCRRLALLLLAAVVAPGCGHEAKIDFTTVTKPPTVQVINPPVRTIVRVVGQPSFIESLRADVGLSQADRLYREVECGHRRQGQEG